MVVFFFCAGMCFVFLFLLFFEWGVLLLRMVEGIHNQILERASFQLQRWEPRPLVSCQEVHAANLAGAVIDVENE